MMISEGLNMDDFLDEFSLFDVMYGGSDSDEDITCTSCARGCDRNSALMPRLPNYKIVHRKKMEFKTNLGVAETEVRQRALGRGRAKRRQGVHQIVSAVGKSDSTSDSDDRLQRRVGLKKELRKPRLKPPILKCNSDFPQLKQNDEQVVTAPQAPHFPQLQPEANGQHGDNEENMDPGNFNDMAQFLMDSWQDEITDGQFEDASVRFNIEDDKSTDENYSYQSNKNNLSDNSIQRKTNDYFNKFEAEVDKIDIDDFKNMSVSDDQVYVINSNSSHLAKRTIEKSGEWYFSDDVYVSENNDLQWNSDGSNDTNISQRTESLLPCDESDSNNEFSGQGELRNQFDFTLPGKKTYTSQGNFSNNANDIPISSPETYSTSSSAYDSMFPQLSSTTSEKDESEPNIKWEKISWKEKKKKRDTERNKKFVDKFPSKGETSPDTNTDMKTKNRGRKSAKFKKSDQRQETNGDWRIAGSSVIQLNGLPIDCDVSVLQDLIASYGTVKDFQKKMLVDSSSVRFRLDSADACEMVVSCLDDTDIFPDAASKISCSVVQ